MPAKCPCGCGHRPAQAGNKMRPLECDVCGCVIRVSRQWLSRMPQLPACPVCGARMDAPCLLDLVLVDESEAQRRADYGKLALGITAGSLRDPGAGRKHRCGGCQRFIRAVNESCECGFHNDIRGGHNQGGYLAGVAVARAIGDDLPF